MLFDATRHEPITNNRWSDGAALDGATNIFEDVCSRLEPGGLWPSHPDEDGQLRFNKSLYYGAAGTIWGLAQLSVRLNKELPFEPGDFSNRVLAMYLEEPDTGSVVPSLLLGEAGILLLQKKFSPGESTLNKLRSCIEANAHNPVNEALWGCPGTMLAALHANEPDIFLKGANYLFEQWTEAGEGIWIWTQDLYGRTARYIGAGHGFFGNVHALLEGQAHLTGQQRELLLERVLRTAVGTARRLNGQANWMPSFFMDSQRLPAVTQWCHGAPGIITSLRSFPRNYSTEMEKLLIEAGEVVWNAGPLKKGIGLCHGTDGNGFALLRLFERTKDEMWLNRAKHFAMHALLQRNGRSTLWTGEIGLALFLIACIDEQANFPILDYF